MSENKILFNYLQFKKICLVLFLLTILNQSNYSQKVVFTPAEINTDLNYLNKYLKKWHPTYYSYNQKPQMDEFLKEVKSIHKGETSLHDFRASVKKIVSKVGCGHMNVWMPKNIVIDSVMALPFDLNIIDQKLYIRKYLGKDSLLNIGDEIVSINSLQSDSLIIVLSNIITSDGHNTTHKTSLLEKAFFIYYYHNFGQSNTTRIVFKNSKNEIKTIILENIIRTNYENYFRNITDSSNIIIKGKYVNLQKTAINSKTFLIDFNAFSGPKLRKSYRQIFKYLKQNNTENLIIDLRDNPGGNVFAGYNFLKYFIKAPVQFVNLSRKPNLTLLNPRYKAGFFERITPLLFMLNPIQYPSKQGWNHAFPFVKHFKNQYDGPLFVITNGLTFSMAAITTTLLKNKANATIIGEETGGSSYASRGMAQGKIILPNSKIQVLLNTYQIKYGKNPDTGHGVIPDFTIKYSFAERNAFADKEYEKVSELIKQQ